MTSRAVLDINSPQTPSVMAKTPVDSQAISSSPPTDGTLYDDVEEALAVYDAL